MTPESLIAPARLARRPVLATQSDGRLVDLVRAGHEPAFEAIVTRYRGALLRYVERFLPRERAEDAVQQTFVRAYEAMLREHSELQLRPWLYRIAHNTALNVLRDRALRHSELPDGLDGVERPDEAFARMQGLRDVLSAVKALPDRQRDAIVLRELEGRTYDEIAAELNVSDGSVRQLLHRARNTLREAATAVTPIGLVARLPWAAPAEPLAVRVAELCGAGVGGAVVAKVCATVLVTGAVAGGVAVAPQGGDREDGPVGPDRAAASEAAGGGEGDGSGTGSGAGGEPASGESVDRSGGGAGGREGDREAGYRSGSGGRSDRSGPGGGDDDATDNSGPGSSGGDSSESISDNSGSGSGSSGSGSGSSGSGSSGSDSDNSGPGSGSTGSGSEGSGSGSSGSGSDSSGSGSDSSGSGSGSSGSGSDSDSSGSGSSGSGSGDDPVTLDSDDSSGSGSGSDSSGSGSSGSG
jgi:RNA polymerase sigma factor (sigma-70 family)